MQVLEQRRYQPCLMESYRCSFSNGQPHHNRNRSGKRRRKHRGCPKQRTGLPLGCSQGGMALWADVSCEDDDKCPNTIGET